jgi:hypothetical protein
MVIAMMIIAFRNPMLPCQLKEKLELRIIKKEENEKCVIVFCD